MNKKERINEAYLYVRAKGLVHSKKDVANKMEASPTNVVSALNGSESCLTDRFIKRFNKAFGDIFNLDWLLNGVGNMLCGPTGDVNSMYNYGDHSTNTQINGNADVAAMQKEIEMLHKLLDEKDRTIETQNTIIELLKNK